MIIPCLNEGDHLRQTVESLCACKVRPDEIIIVDNGSSDGCSDFIERENYAVPTQLFKLSAPLGVSKARNFGAERATGEILVFVDAHVLFPETWIKSIQNALRNQAVGIAAPGGKAWGNPRATCFGYRLKNLKLEIDYLRWKGLTPYAVPMVPGFCQAFRKDLFQQIGGYDAGMINYGMEDTEICIRLWLLGYQVQIIPNILVTHLFRPRFPYEVSWTNLIYNSLRTVHAHFNSERVERAIAELKSLPDFDNAVNLLNTSDIWDRRRNLESIRQHDDSWFFEKFGMKL
ncbi:MAG: glycosyltransferase family 2 protein [Chloroflexi bacterium]|nr:glycosyltransferase family 2 protein [Chloroflexota bacterium]